MDKDKLRVLPKITTLHKTYFPNADNYFLGVPLRVGLSATSPRSLMCRATPFRCIL